ncbi:MAG TPA: thiamine pyrophosphate-dependent enzyme, partial [Geminicoccaceae bacterium]|nr:thiamine pyrophosphate-dependent enzyme [Geminicoccaceae bacterium]
MTTRHTVATTLTAELHRRGVRRMFGVPGGGSSLDLIEAGAAHGIDFVLTRSETAAAIMAATTAELTGAPGVVLTGLGPGAAAATNGLAQAALDRSPVVLVSDAYPPEVATRTSHQRIDHAALFAPLIKATLAPTGASAAGELRRLLDLAAAPPAGPVHIDLSARAAAEPMAADDDPMPQAAPPQAPVQDAEARALLARAARPVLLVGLQACRTPAAARALAEELGGPVLTTWKAKGVIASDHPLFVGLFTGAEAEAVCVGEADLIVQLGLDPVELIPRPWRYRAPIIDIAEVTAPTPHALPTAALIGPLEAGAEALKGARREPGWPTATIESFRRRIARCYRMSPSRAISPQALVEAAVEAAPVGCRAAVDAGAHMFPVMAFWPARQAHEVLISNGLATMGFALPAAIASVLAEPERPVIAFTGDGGLMMTLAELATAAERNCALVVVVFNDQALSLIDLKQEA